FLEPFQISHVPFWVLAVWMRWLTGLKIINQKLPVEHLLALKHPIALHRAKAHYQTLAEPNKQIAKDKHCEKVRIEYAENKRCREDRPADCTRDRLPEAISPAPVFCLCDFY